MVIVDTGPLAFLLLPGELTDLAQRAYARDPAWASVPLWRSEFRNLLVRQVREGRLDADAARDILQAAEEKMHPRQYHVSGENVLELAAATGLPAYPCEYLALARELNLPLLTTDETLLRAAPKIAVSLADFVARQG